VSSGGVPPSRHANCYDRAMPWALAGRSGRIRRVAKIIAGALAILVGSAQSQTKTPRSTAEEPPASRFSVVNGARLEYLDWGGDGSPLVFLAGLGSTAHIFSDLAPAFTSGHHCLGLTRRGFGRSEQTADGYELDNLVLDIVTFGRSLGLRNIVLVGHSYGGIEAVRASELYPELIRGVILLDTAYDLIPSAAPAAETKLFAAITHMTSTQRVSSLENYRGYEKRLLGNLWSDGLEADLRETVIVAKNGSIGDRTPGRIHSAIVSERAEGKWHITSIPSPALLIFAQDSWADLLPGLHLDAATTAEILKAGAELEAARRSQIEAFRRDSPLARIVELEHTDHHCFIQRRERVVQEMQQFFADARAH
jgi:non-heme chloroperoxidase